jgi:non-heme chloroperoxidase
MNDRAAVHVVDDDASLRGALESLFDSVGLAAQTCGTAGDFLNTNLADAPGCIVIDIRLPDMNGLEFQARLTQIGVRLPVVMTTGYGDIPRSVRAMKRGAVDFLPKPFRDQDMLDAVRQRSGTPPAREQQVMLLATAGKMNKQIAGDPGNKRGHGENLPRRGHASLPGAAFAATPETAESHNEGEQTMSTITTKDGVEIFYKDWGKGQPIVFSHGWPLSADDWDAQMLFFLRHGYRVIAHDRRGHGRSSQTSDGHDMDHYADDLAALTEHLDLKNAIHVGHSTGGGEVVHYLGRHGESRVAKAAIISAVPPLMVKTAANPGGLPKEVFDGLQAQLAADRSQFYRDLPAGPFYGFNRPGAKASEAIIQNWWRQGMMGGAKAHYDGIVAFSQTDFTEDLKKIMVPVLVMHGEDDQIVPYADAGPLSAKLLRNGTLKSYKGFPHGMPTTQAEIINADLLAFLKA